MSHEEPVGFTKDGELITALRFTDAEWADIFMANEMYMASPEWQDRYRQFRDGLPDATLTIGPAAEWH